LKEVAVPSFYLHWLEKATSNRKSNKEAEMTNEIITNEEFSMNAGMISTVVAALVFIMAPIVLLTAYFVKAPLW
jgi:hypothetical protein